MGDFSSQPILMARVRKGLSQPTAPPGWAGVRRWLPWDGRGGDCHTRDLCVLHLPHHPAPPPLLSGHLSAIMLAFRASA